MISLQFLLTAFVVVLAPGTGVIYTIALGLGQGPRAAIWAAVGCTVGILPHLAAATLGLAAVLHASALLFQTVKVAGVLYLLYLAWQMLKAGGALSVSAVPSSRQSGLRIAQRGALINILNPKLSVFFLALLPPFLSGAASSATEEMIVLGAIFMAMTFAIFALYGLFAAQARNLILGSETVVKWLNRSFAVLFTALATRLAMERA
ncbi:LysE family translocator [Phaeobacter porticola]|uniref:LysE type translocator-like protein n=1 Tax=Phaeobacter porticola TaxID=1844006 RepID=A0A1L3I0X3_9RHOB|nr:LysE family translocator [Phaeobacter porticola]APG45774.1 lysE type translocator-like protein [Phaeobacter porticola]